MNIQYRSVLQKLSHPCLQDNTEIEVHIYRQIPEGMWAYVPSGAAVRAQDRHKAVITVRNIGNGIDFDDVKIRVARSEEPSLHDIIVLFEDSSFGKEVDTVNLVMGALRSPNIQALPTEREKQAAVFFTVGRRVRAKERKNLFAYRVAARVVPKGHYHQSLSPQPDFARPVISVSGNYFGAVTVGKRPSSQFKIANRGDVDLIVDTITIEPQLQSDSAFDVTLSESLPSTLKPGESKVFGSITFSPTKEEVFQRSVKISSNDPVSPVKNVLLKGTGAHWFRVSPKSIDFGTVDSFLHPQGVTREFTMKNTHSTEMCTARIEPRLAPPEEDGVVFIFSRCSVKKPCVLEAGDSVKVKVTAKTRKGRAGEHVQERRITLKGEASVFYITLKAYAELHLPPTPAVSSGDPDL